MNQITAAPRPSTYARPMSSSRPGSFLETPPPRQLTPAPPPSRIKILAAGVDKDARGAVEATVRRAFEGRDPSEAWSVSLVRLGSAWSVTLSGPGERFRHLSFSADRDRLASAIREAISNASAPAAAPAASGPAQGSERTRVEERHVCVKCQQALVVSYESEPGEPRERVPVACPHCWAANHVEIGSWAASGGDYSAARA